MKHILLLEDDAGIVDLLSSLLEEDGYYVSSTARADDAREILERAKVDLLIADIVLPGGTAFPAIDEARKRNVACLIMTGSFPHMAQLEANGEFYLSKPFKLRELTDNVLRRIGSGNGQN
jgi:two-component system OmpR family response regulator